MTPAPSPVRLGIAGCGNVLGAYLPLIERLRHQGRVEIVGFCGRERQRHTVLQAYPNAQFFTGFSELTRREDVDAVVILTPMAEHAGMAQQALEAGKHVLVEKPLAQTLEAARRLIATSQARERLLVCAPFTVLSPTFQIVNARLQEGVIGKVVSGRARYGWAGPDWTEWFYRRGAGAMFDLGVYSLTTLTGWLGPVQRVTAMTATAIPGREIQGKRMRVEVDDNAQILLDFGGGCLAVVTTGFTIQQYRGPGIELFGTEGTLYLHGDDWDPDGYEVWQNSAGCWQLYKETQPEWPWTDGLRHMVDCIQGCSPLRVTPEHALHVLDVMLQAQAAGADGNTREVQSTFERRAAAVGNTGVAAHRVHDRTRQE